DVGHRLAPFLVEISDENPAACCGELARGGLAQPACAAGHDRSGPVQFHGGSLLGQPPARPNGVREPGAPRPRVTRAAPWARGDRTEALRAARVASPRPAPDFVGACA